MTNTGLRRGRDDGEGGQLGHVGLTGWYWSSSDEQRSPAPYSLGSEIHFFDTEDAQMNITDKSQGFCVRCIIN
jgi:hypothetical protein